MQVWGEIDDSYLGMFCVWSQDRTSLVYMRAGDGKLRTITGLIVRFTVPNEIRKKLTQEEVTIYGEDRGICTKRMG